MSVQRRGAHPDEVHPSTQTFAQLTVLQRRHAELGHESASGEHGQHARIDQGDLARQRRDVTDLARMRDLHPPPAAASLSRSQIAPLIISTTARTSVPRSITSRARP